MKENIGKIYISYKFEESKRIFLIAGKKVYGRKENVLNEKN